MDVSHQFQQVAVAIRQQCLVAPLKQVASPALPAVDPLGVAKGEVLQALREGDVAHLQNQVKGVGHAAETVHAITESLGALLQQPKKTAVVFAGKEDVSTWKADPPPAP
jgi:hypothetical protein